MGIMVTTALNCSDTPPSPRQWRGSHGMWPANECYRLRLNSAHQQTSYVIVSTVGDAAPRGGLPTMDR